MRRGLRLDLLLGAAGAAHAGGLHARGHEQLLGHQRDAPQHRPLVRAAGLARRSGIFSYVRHRDLLNGAPGARLPGNAHFSFPGCEGDALLLLLDAQGVYCSTGSACSAGVAQPSHVLLAMGADDGRARSSLRFTLGHDSTGADVDALLAVLPGAVERACRAGAWKTPR